MCGQNPLGLVQHRQSEFPRQPGVGTVKETVKNSFRDVTLIADTRGVDMKPDLSSLVINCNCLVVDGPDKASFFLGPIGVPHLFPVGFISS
jgi:hypothetical protein